MVLVLMVRFASLMKFRSWTTRTYKSEDVSLEVYVKRGLILSVPLNVIKQVIEINSFSAIAGGSRIVALGMHVGSTTKM